MTLNPGMTPLISKHYKGALSSTHTLSLQLRSAGAQALQEQLWAVTCVGSLDLSDNGEWGRFPSWGPGADRGLEHGGEALRRLQ